MSNTLLVKTIISSFLVLEHFVGVRHDIMRTRVQTYWDISIIRFIRTKFNILTDNGSNNRI